MSRNIEYATVNAAGHEVNVTRRNDGTIIAAAVMVGPADRAGMRAKDGSAARNERKRIRLEVAEALSIPVPVVRAVSRFTRIKPDGSVRDNSGRVIGQVIPR